MLQADLEIELEQVANVKSKCKLQRAVRRESDVETNGGSADEHSTVQEVPGNEEPSAP